MTENAKYDQTAALKTKIYVDLNGPDLLNSENKFSRDKKRSKKSTKILQKFDIKYGISSTTS